MDKRDFEKVEVKKGTTLRVLTVQRETAAAAMREGKKEVPRIVFVSCCLLFRQERRFESKIDSYMWFARRHLFPFRLRRPIRLTWKPATGREIPTSEVNSSSISTLELCVRNGKDNKFT